MKQKNNGIKRLLEFTGNKRGVLNLSRILSGISAIFILGPWDWFLPSIFTYGQRRYETYADLSGFFGNDESRSS